MSYFRRKVRPRVTPWLWQCMGWQLFLSLDGLCTQVWYVDDSWLLKNWPNSEWWDKLTCDGPNFGYFANPSKTWLVTKDSFFKEASAIFANSGVNITPDGSPYLGEV